MQFHVLLLHVGWRWTVLCHCHSYKILRLWRLGPIVVRARRYESIQIKGLWKVVASIYECFWWFLRTSSVGGESLHSGEVGQRHRLRITYAWEEGVVVTTLALLPRTSIQSWVASRLGAQIVSHSDIESFGDVKVDPVISVGKKLWFS